MKRFATLHAVCRGGLMILALAVSTQVGAAPFLAVGDNAELFLTVNAVRTNARLTIKVDFSPEMKLNETKLVELTISGFSQLPASVIPKQIEAHLFSSAFDIAPENKQVLVIRPRDQSLAMSWTITPRNDGSHEMLLNLRALLQAIEELTTNHPEYLEIEDDNIFMRDPKNSGTIKVEGVSLPINWVSNNPKVFQTNSLQGELPATGCLRLHVDVATRWGIQQRTQDAIAWFVAGVSFVLMFPLFHHWLRRRLGWGSNES